MLIWIHSAAYPEAKLARLIPGRGIIGTAEGCCVKNRRLSTVGGGRRGHHNPWWPRGHNKRDKSREFVAQPPKDLIIGYMSTRAQVRYSSLHPSVPRKASGFSEYGYRFGNCLCSISCVIVVHLGQVLSVRRIASPNVCSICTGVQESHTCRAGENRRWWTLQ